MGHASTRCDARRRRRTRDHSHPVAPAPPAQPYNTSKPWVFLADYSKEALHRLLPWLAGSELSGAFTAPALRQTIRDGFRAPAPPADQNELLDRAFTALRVLEDQVHMAQCTSRCTTDGVTVEVTTAYVGTRSEIDPTYESDNDEEGPKKYYYTYRVRISNVG